MMKLFHNATFYSMENEETIYNAILVEKDKIIDVYKDKPSLDHIENIDMKGRFVYPGFSDTHTHSFEGGLYSLSVNLENVSCLNDVFQLLAAAKPIAGKIFAYHFDETLIKEKRFPTIDELDKIWPDTPLLLRRVDGHSCVINSEAVKKIPWDKPLPSNFNGYLYKRLNGKASNWFHRNLDDDSILSAYQAASDIAISNGITSVHTMIGDAYSDAKHYQLISDNLESFQTHFVLYPQISDVKLALDLGAVRIGGCILADGSFGSHTAALKEPYTDDPTTNGTLYRSNNNWASFIEEAHLNNLQVCIHCIGDAAIDQILSCYEAAESKTPKYLKHEIIHNELTDDSMLDRMASHNISAVMQPMFDYLWAGPNGLYEKRLGKERTKRTNRLRSIYNRNILLTGGSDWYITELNALYGINAATKIYNHHERLTPYQATEIYTKNPAILANEEHLYGKISKGLSADFVALDNDILSTKEIDKIQVKEVYKNGDKLL